MSDQTPATHSTPALRLPAKFSATQTGLEIAGQLTEQQWLKAGQCLADASKALPWLIGDWILAGEQQWGKTYEEAEEITGLAYKTLANAASVCKRVEFSRRRENLSFRHHAEVASLDPDDQAELLEAAERGNWTTETMRQQVRALKGLPTPDMEETNNDVEQEDGWEERETDDAGDTCEDVGADCCGLPVDEPDTDNATTETDCKMSRRTVLGERGDLKANPGSRPWAVAMRQELASCLHDAEFSAERAERLYVTFQDHKGWAQLENRDGSRFMSFEQFCCCDKPFGLGYNTDHIERIIHDWSVTALQKELAQAQLEASKAKSEAATLWKHLKQRKLSPFEILLCRARQSEEKLKQAYRTLSTKLHPDHGGDGEQFRQLQADYEQVQWLIKQKASYTGREKGI